MTKQVLEPSSANIWRALQRLSLRPVRQDEDSDWHERTGYFMHPRGTAVIWQGWSSKVDASWTTIELIDREGFHHIRQWRRVHPRKTLSRLARIMIEDFI